MAMVFWGICMIQHIFGSTGRYMKLYSIIMCVCVDGDGTLLKQSQRPRIYWCWLPSRQRVFNAFIRHLLAFLSVSSENSAFLSPQESACQTAMNHDQHEDKHRSTPKNYVLTWKIIFDKIKLNNNKIFSAAVLSFTRVLWEHFNAELLPPNEYECFRWNWAH